MPENQFLMLKNSTRYSPSLSLPDYLRLPDGSFDRERTLRLLLTEEYGFVRTDGVHVSYEVEKEKEQQVAGKCKIISVRVDLEKEDRKAAFPFRIFLPYGAEGERTVLNINFDRDVPNRYAPIEELMDMKLTVVYLCHKDVTSDDADFSNGIAPLLCDRTRPDDAGKIAIWAYAAQLVADFLIGNGYAKPQTLAVAGHSRLGKTALLTGALDDRFAYVHSNCSGCCGAAISREKTGETIADIYRQFPYWFCPDFGKYCGRESEMPFDQHFLMALIAPRKLSVVAAELDTWADTDAQYFCAEAAGRIYEEAGVPGLDESNGILQMNERSTAGTIAFCKRSGTHFFSRADWQFFNTVFH